MWLEKIALLSGRYFLPWFVLPLGEGPRETYISNTNLQNSTHFPTISDLSLWFYSKSTHSAPIASISKVSSWFFPDSGTMSFKLTFFVPIKCPFSALNAFIVFWVAWSAQDWNFVQLLMTRAQNGCWMSYVRKIVKTFIFSEMFDIQFQVLAFFDFLKWPNYIWMTVLSI